MSIFTDIERVRKETSGWTSQLKAETLASLVMATRPKIVCEVGVWFGKGFFPMAMTLKHLGSGTAHAIDPWYAGCSIAGQTDPKNIAWWSHQDYHEQAYDFFKKKVVELGLQNIVTINRMDSQEFDVPDGIGVASIDGNHSEQSIKDVFRYCPKIIPGGYVILDDLNWEGRTDHAGKVLVRELPFRELYIVDDPENKNQWGVYQRL